MAISLEQAKLCYELGIKQRDDGKWGFKLRCANRTCNSYTDTCYCENEVEHAIQAVRTRRSAYWCSAECYMKDERFWLREAEIEDYLEGTETMDSVWAHFDLNPNEDDAELPKNWRKTIRDENPNLWATIQSEVQEAISENWDGDRDDGECECEV